MLANYHTTIWIPFANAALALATSTTPASCCSPLSLRQRPSKGQLHRLRMLAKNFEE